MLSHQHHFRHLIWNIRKKFGLQISLAKSKMSGLQKIYFTPMNATREMNRGNCEIIFSIFFFFFLLLFVDINLFRNAYFIVPNYFMESDRIFYCKREKKVLKEWRQGIIFTVPRKWQYLLIKWWKKGEKSFFFNSLHIVVPTFYTYTTIAYENNRNAGIFRVFVNVIPLMISFYLMRSDQRN